MSRSSKNRLTNAIESTFATVRHRTTRTRNCVSRPTFLGLAFKLIEEAEKTWRRINGPEQIKLLLEGIASEGEDIAAALARKGDGFPENTSSEVITELLAFIVVSNNRVRANAYFPSFIQ